MESTEEELKDRVRRLREESGMSQVTLGNLVGVTSHTIKNIESGRKGVSVQTFAALAKAFGITMEQLLGHEPPRAEKVVKFKLRQVIKYFESIPDDIYDLALDMKQDKEAWDSVRGAMRGEIKNLKARAAKEKQSLA